MKRLFVLIAVFCVAIAANTKTWNFTNWSEATLNMLKSVAVSTVDDNAEWRTVEKSGGCGEGVDGCYFKVGSQTYAPVLVNGIEIPELRGLRFSCKGSSPALGLIWNMQTTTDANAWGPYNAPAYVWIFSAGDTISVPDVRRGTKLTIGVESHKPSEARGFDLYIDGAVVTADDEAAVKVKTYAEVSWTIPAGDGVKTEAKLVASKGCHISFITIESDDTKTPIAYLYNATQTAGLKDRLSSLEYYTATPIDLSITDLSTLSLRDYDCVVIDPAVGVDYAEFLKAQLPWQPVVNFSSELYEAWGYGVVTESSTELAEIKQENAILFAGIEIVEEGDQRMFSVTNGEAMPVGLALQGNFADDDVYAVDYKEEGDETPSAVLFHSHNTHHNAYYYMPYNAEALADVPEGTEPIFANVITAAAGSKSKISPTPAPEITVENGNRNATVTIVDKIAKAAIYYTTDGSDPTPESMLYKEPVVLTEDCTIKVVALGEGYELSEVVSADVVMLDQLDMPVISMRERDNGEAVDIEISHSIEPKDGEEIAIYYNYTGNRDAAVSSTYTEPIQIYNNPGSKQIYAFTVSNMRATSEAAQETILPVSKPRRNVITHINCSSADWNAGSTSTNYYFSWRKTARSMYQEDVDSITGEIITIPLDPETQGVKLAEGTEVADSMNLDWQLKSYGQVMDWLKMSTTYDLANSAAYNAWKVDDLDNSDKLITSGSIQFGGKKDGESANASIETIKPFKGPFNIFLVLGNGQKPSEDSPTVSQHTFEIAVSKDTTDVNGWVAVDSVKSPNVGRNWTRIERAYNGNDEVFVRVKQVLGGSSAYITDIYLFGGSDSDVLLGDANDDGFVNVNDITAIASFILNGTAELWNEKNADANCDGIINVNDITTTAAIILK